MPPREAETKTTENMVTTMDLHIERIGNTVKIWVDKEEMVAFTHEFDDAHFAYDEVYELMHRSEVQELLNRSLPPSEISRYSNRHIL
jgi:hypothetical protein